MKKIVLLVLLAFAGTSATTPRIADAWNDRGHRLVQAIAWLELTDEARAKVTALLEAHPVRSDLLLDVGSADSERFYAFLTSGTWPDMVRPRAMPRDQFHSIRKRAHHQKWHYITHAWVPEEQVEMPDEPTTAWEPGDRVGNCVQGILKATHDLKSGAPNDEKAIALCWLGHLFGDIHQPLHAASIYTARYPDGDRGGNSFAVHVGGRTKNLHKVWDGALGGRAPTNPIFHQAVKVVRDHPPSTFGARLAVSDPAKWAEESHYLARKHAHGPMLDVALDPDADTPRLSAAYMENAGRVAAEQAALGGYRLALLLNEWAGERRLRSSSRPPSEDMQALQDGGLESAVSQGDTADTVAVPVSTLSLILRKLEALEKEVKELKQAMDQR